MQPLPYGITWDKNPDGSGGVIQRRMTPEELSYQERQSRPAANVVNTPPMFLDDNENIYKDEGGVIRNMKQDTPSGVSSNDPRLYAPSPYAGSGGGSTPAPSYGGGEGGGFGRSSGSSFTGSWPQARTKQSHPGGGSNTIPGGSTGSILTRGGSTDMPSLSGGQQMGASQYSVNMANQNAGAMTGVGDQLQAINPQVGQMDRTLYDQYAGFLSNPDQMLNNPIVAAALQKAQQAAGRQLSAGRMSRSGNAAQAISEATGQTLLGQYYNMAQTLGGGAQQEQSRWGMQTSAGLDAARVRAGALGAAGQMYSGAGTLGLQAGTAEAANVNNEELERMRRAQFISSMTGDPYKGLQAGGFGTMTQQQGVTQGRAAGMFDPGYAGTPYTQSTFNLSSAYGGTTAPVSRSMNYMPTFNTGSGRLL